MKTTKAAEFKARCLKVMDEVAARGEDVVITKRGKVVARILPPQPALPTPNYFGWAHGTLDVVGDVLAPIDTAGWTLDGEPWEDAFPDPDLAPPTPAPRLADRAGGHVLSPDRDASSAELN